MRLLLAICALMMIAALSVSENQRMVERFNNSMAHQTNFGGNYR